MSSFKHMTEDEKNEFSAKFYEAWDAAGLGEKDDSPDNPAPWGAPWEWCGNEEAITAETFFQKHEKAIRDAKAREEEEKE